MGVKLRAPISNIVKSPTMKFQFLNIVRSKRGFFEKIVLDTKNRTATRQINSSADISKDSNQSNRCPRSSNNWADPATDGNTKTYSANLVVDYVEDLTFNPIDKNGELIFPIPSVSQNSEKLDKIRSIDIALILRSTDEFYRNKKERTTESISDDTIKNRNSKKTDKFLRDAIIVTAYARNIGTN